MEICQTASSVSMCSWGKRKVLLEKRGKDMTVEDFCPEGKEGQTLMKLNSG